MGSLRVGDGARYPAPMAMNRERQQKSALVAANGRLRLYDPLTVTAAWNVVVLAGYLHYVLSVISQICYFLGIRCLSLKKAGGDAAAAAKAE